MVIKAVQPLRIKMPEGPRDLLQGEQISLPERVGLRLLKLVPRKVEVVPRNALQSGICCEWVSPLFGQCTGQVVSMTVKGYIVTNHSVIGSQEQIEIPFEWISGVHEG